MPQVLVVDDEPGVRESLRMLLQPECEVSTAANVDEALKAFADSPPDLILLDLVMPGRNGLELLAELSERGSTVPSIVLTATTTIDAAVEAMKRGASDFITKPFELEALRMKVRALLKFGALQEEVVLLREEVENRQRLVDMIGRSPAMRSVFQAVERVAKTRANVLVTGESGTGKELAAQAIHSLSPRKDGPFVAINCGAIPHHLIESELFGHEKGAFTDAVDRRIGRFEAAAGGTLLLDEIGELDASLQVKLLRALQERRIERLGSSESIDVDVRFVAATNRQLDREVEAGRFREDLFYRINVVPIAMPPLRDRREDISLLAEAILERLSREANRPLRLGPGTLTALESHHWPGNVRELENALEHGAALSDSGVLLVEDLPESTSRAGRDAAISEDWRAGRVDFEQTMARFETGLLREALERSDWNQTRAAQDLGITRRVLKLKMDRFEIRGGAEEDLDEA